MKTKIQKVTTKGQITLPVKWRKNLENSYVSVEVSKKGLVINPITMENDTQWETIFDAKRDNKGKGISAKKFSQLLKESRKK
jgi:bifunctional DNA-binding transcriptional regulator/antitoxin component of YhaV-PrlF toxin-antitoxin module